MGTPTQGLGTTTPWVADGSGFDAATYNLPNDGSQWSFTTVMVLIARLINSVGAIYAGTMLVTGYSGAMWTITAGQLSTFLHDLADHAPKLNAGLNTFTGAVYGAVMRGTVLWAYTQWVRGDVQIGTTATAYTVDFTGSIAPLIEARAWAGTGGNLTITLANYGGIYLPEVEVIFAPATSGAICLIQDAGTTALVYLAGADRCVMRWNGGAWVRVNGGHLAA